MKKFFGTNREVFQASAPGRMDVMGGIADYSGSKVLQKTISERTTASVSLRNDGMIRVYSPAAGQMGSTEEVSIHLENLIGKTGDYSYSRNQILSIKGGDWAIYVIGCLLVLIKEKEIKFSGADIWISSQVPLGKGVSSSAAVEIATMMSVVKAFDLKMNDTELPPLAQKVENLVVGAPCGLMDQLASFHGEKNKLLPILCQPDMLYPSLIIPEGINFVGIDSGIRHSVSGASYGDVRVAAFMGYSIIALECGAQEGDLKYAFENSDASALPYKGYLANISPGEFEKKFRNILPAKISGKEFLNKHKYSIDRVTIIDPDKVYEVYNCTKHPVYENFRVNTFCRLLGAYHQPAIGDLMKLEYLRMMGELMYQSHAAYSLCRLGNAHTDELLEMARSAGYENGIYGAKITGGGSGGTVCLLCYNEKGIEGAKEIYNKYSAKYGFKLVFFQGSSDGGQKSGAARFII